MNTLLSFLAGLLALVLVALFAAPVFIDWNRFRPEIKAELSEYLGREVEIAGNISVRFLPTPSVDVAEATLANDSRSQSGPLLKLKALEAEIALAPLLSGAVRFTRLHMIRPLFTLETFADGSTNIDAFLLEEDANTPRSGGVLEKVRLDSFTIEDGSIRYLDRKRSWQVSMRGIDAEIAATSLLGPFKGEGEFSYRGRDYEMRLNISRFDRARAVPVELELREGAHGLKLTFSGIITEALPARGLDGTLVAEAHTIAGLLPWMQTDRKGRGEKGNKGQAVRLEAGVVLNTQSAALRNMQAVLGETKLEGGAQVYFAPGQRRAELRVKAKSVDTAALALPRDAAPASSISGLLATLVDLSARAPKNMPVAVRFDIDNVFHGEERLRAIALDAQAEEGRLSNLSISAELPGAARVSFRTDARPLDKKDKDKNVLAGHLDLEARAARPFLLWLIGGRTSTLGAAVDKIAPALWGALRARASVRIAPERIEAKYDTLSLGALNVEGSLRYDISGKGGALNLNLALASFDTEPYIAAFDELSTLAQRMSTGKDAPDWTIALRASKLLYGDVVLRDARFEARRTKGVFEATRASLSFAGGGRFSGSARIMTGEEPEGTITATLEAKKAKAFLQLFGVDLPRAQTTALAKAKLKTEINLGGKKKTRAKIKLVGQVNGSAILLNATLDPWRAGFDSWIDMKASLQNKRGERLAAQLGVPPSLVVKGKGEAKINMKGALDAPLPLEARLRFGSARYALTKGMISHDRGRISQISGALTAEGPDIGFWRRGKPYPYTLTAMVQSGAENTRLREIVVKAGGGTLTGSGEIARDKENIFIESELKADLLPLDIFVSSTAEKEWSTDPLSVDNLKGVDGALRLSAARALWGGIEIEDVKLSASLDDGRLKLDEVRANLAGGKLRASAGLRGRRGTAEVSLDFSLSNLDMARATEMLWGYKAASGRLDVSGDVLGRGRSLLALVSSLSGKLRANAEAGAFLGFDIAKFDKGLADLSRMAQFAPLTKDAFGGGKTVFSAIDASGVIADGVITIAEASIRTKAARRARARVFVDLPRFVIDAEMRYALARNTGFPDVRFLLTGALAKPRARGDTSDVRQALQERIVEKGIEQLSSQDEVPQELLDILEDAAPAP